MKFEFITPSRGIEHEISKNEKQLKSLKLMEIVISETNFKNSLICDLLLLKLYLEPKFI